MTGWEKKIGFRSEELSQEDKQKLAELVLGLAAYDQEQNGSEQPAKSEESKDN